ncbi:hypothetical protein YDYSY3_37970 [Paenibacillus chitinolyticus]|uniref:DUF4258 domain-containing protein n=1 Tax=Paenibacillus chitinolyticus TaxID=79263 RepID=UPI0026E50290|nr:DUF4258 domain-containing protein [Paenibacillus chitinolyticus]GKS12797.1 hypothetical protein YDYSY3_37970 [Paenibacillus chitinolyticus]
MDHMEKYWSEELERIRKGVNQIDGYTTTISPHYLRDRLGNDAYPDRVFDELDIVWAIAHGKIVEGFDSGEKGRNPEPERTILGPALSGEWTVVIVLMKTDKQFIVKTVFPVKGSPRYSKYIPV